ncbi:unnamed protein product [Prorocentrum cordatum]|uniref:DUF6314 domain-containing protein n=1 Tax=Prorocentrum cordatum TaxID=2364126 RepID=A0ABN9SDZ6_9DINO|nr:unnamed protein product [Polarella glacialis]
MSRPLSATRRYSYRFPAGGDPTEAQVFFADGPSEGQFFHSLRLQEGAWAAHHLCVADHYSGEFRAASASRWEAVWRVRGPKKDQVLHSVYEREAPAAGARAEEDRP